MKLITKGERLKYAIAKVNLNSKTFSSKINLNYASIQNIISNTTSPSYKIINAVCKELNITADWFLYGKGEMYQSDYTPEPMPEPNHALMLILKWLNKKWDDDEERNRIWLEVQMQNCFPRYDAWLKRNEKRHPDCKPDQKAPAVWMKKEWEDSDEKHQNWLEVEMEEHFPAYKKWAGRGIRKEKE